MKPRRAAWLLLAAGLALGACSAPDGQQPEETDPGESSGPDETSSAPAPESPPSQPLAWGPDEEDLQHGIDQASELSLEEVAGQVIIARYDGTDPATPAALVADLDLGGVVLFAENIAGLDQVIDSADQVQTAGAERDWPTIMSVDNEGGQVQRFSGASGPWTTFPPFAAAGGASADVVTDAMAAMALELRASGINVNFAPDADVTIGAQDPAIGDRSASSDPQQAATAVDAAVTGFADGGILSSLKHFPGHGALTVDSHEGMPVQDASTDELRDRDLIPFEAGIDAGAPSVMMGHIDVQAWDEGVPASLSPAAYDYLREELDFTGVAITDGLEMGALEQFGDAGQIAVTAIEAGADLLLGPTDVQLARDSLVAAVEDGSLSRDRLDEAAGRVITMMTWQEQLADSAPDVGAEDVGSAAEAAQALADGE